MPKREEMMKELLWLTPDSGTGLGLCSVATTSMWGSQRPSEDNPDWPSIVALKGPPEKYTDEELEKIHAFALEVTARYDQMFNWRQGANLIIIHKENDRFDGRTVWWRKRMTWSMGKMWDETLDEALNIFRDKEASATTDV